jgi:hypothetical protein
MPPDESRLYVIRALEGYLVKVKPGGESTVGYVWTKNLSEAQRYEWSHVRMYIDQPQGALGKIGTGGHWLRIEQAPDVLEDD